MGVLIALLVTLAGPGPVDGSQPAVFRTLVLASVLPAVLAVLGLALLARETPLRSEHRDLPTARAWPVRSTFPGLPGDHGPVHAGQLLRCVPGPAGPACGTFGPGRTRHGPLVQPGLQPALGPRGCPVRQDRQAKLLVAGWLVYARIYLGFAAITAGWQAWVLMAFYGIYAACFEGVAKAFVADLVPPAHRGTAYGVFHTAIGLAALPASLIAGILWEGIGPWTGWGPRAPFVFGAGMALAASILLATALPRTGAAPRRPRPDRASASAGIAGRSRSYRRRASDQGNPHGAATSGLTSPFTLVNLLQ